MTKTLNILEKLNRPVLVLNKQWTPMASQSVEDALKNVYNEKAKILGPDYQLFNMDEWIELGPIPRQPSIMSAYGAMRLPEVAVNSTYNKLPKKRSKFSRRNIWKRDKFCCQYCGCIPDSNDITIDHVIPQRLWDDEWTIAGVKMPFKKTSFENCVLACTKCNKAKDGRTPKQAGMHLFRTEIINGKATKVVYEKPELPRWNPGYDVHRKKMPRSWKEWLADMNNELYWEVEIEQ